MRKFLWLMFFSFSGSTVSLAQNQNVVCILNTAKDGQMLTARGKALQQPHDLAFSIVGCNDPVILTFAGNQDNNVSANLLRKDKNLKRFQKYTSAVYKDDTKNICVECPQYGDVEATLTGRLEIATIPIGTTKDQMGFLHDASGKIVGTSGFGHPTRMFKYRLVILSASDVRARKLPKPKPTSQPK